MIGYWGQISRSERQRARRMLSLLRVSQVADAAGRSYPKVNASVFLSRVRSWPNRSSSSWTSRAQASIPSHGKDFSGIFSKLAQKKRAPALVLVTHHIEEIVPEFTHVLALRKGRLVYSGPKTRGLEAETLERIFDATLNVRKSDFAILSCAGSHEKPATRTSGDAMRAQYFSVSRARLLQGILCKIDTIQVFAQVSKAPRTITLIVFAAIESFWHRLRRRLSRNEWAVRHLAPSRLRRAPAKSRVCCLIQIDGLPRRQLESAMAAGRMPFSADCANMDAIRFTHSTPACQAPRRRYRASSTMESRTGVPAFSFLDRERGEMGMLFDPELARRFEEKFAAHGEGLLKGGSSWSNIFSGGASPAESNFCVAHTGFGDVWRSGRILNVLFFILLQLPAMIRITCLVLLELVIGLPEAARGIFRGQWFSQELGMVLSRMCVGVALREIVTIGGKVDVTRGLPVVHLNFLGYDELSHRRGPASTFAHWSLEASIGPSRISTSRHTVPSVETITSGYSPITAKRRPARSRWNIPRE